MRHFLMSLLWLAVFLAAMGLAWMYLLPYVLPFALAAFVALLMDPAVNLAERWLRLPRGVAVAFVMLLGVVLLALVVIGLSAALVAEFKGLQSTLGSLFSRGRLLVVHLVQSYDAISAELPADAQTMLSNILSNVQGQAEDILNRLPDLLQGIGSLPTLVIIGAVTTVATFFFSRDKRLIVNFLLSLLPDEWRHKVNAAKADVMVAAVGFVKAELSLITLTLLLSIIGLNLIGAGYTFVAGVIIAVLDIVPVLGPGLLFIPWAAVNFILGNWGFGIGLVVVYAITSAVRQFLQAKVLGDRIGLHPLATLLAIYLGLKIFGAAGIVFGPATVIILKALVRARLLPLFQYEGDAS